jgi:biotin operon repressor
MVISLLPIPCIQTLRQNGIEIYAKNQGKDQKEAPSSKSGTF